ncbi:MAG: hypothetical protein HFJ75_08260 [Eggerthellaceae bacterium]|nr:hypothetical protein [Eggerthellaceae bacterium]
MGDHEDEGLSPQPAEEERRGRRAKGAEYVPPDMDDGRDAPRAEEFGVVGSWPVPAHRPKL